ncbi:MAG: hypothetical protein V3T51_04390 [Gammaproteobacteria bacterium]
MAGKRSVEHYREHELVCEVSASRDGWRYRVSIVGHHGDTSEVKCVASENAYNSDVEALRAAKIEGRRIIDQRLEDSGT